MTHTTIAGMGEAEPSLSPRCGSRLQHRIPRSGRWLFQPPSSQKQIPCDRQIIWNFKIHRLLTIPDMKFIRSTTLRSSWGKLLVPALLGLLGPSASGALALLTDDTFVDSGFPTSVRNSADPVRIRVRSDASNTRKSFLRFDTSSVIYTGNAIGGVTLTLTLANNAAAGNINNSVQLWGITDLAQGDNPGNWSESTLTWSNSATRVQNDTSSATNLLSPGAIKLGNALDVSGGYTSGTKMTFESSELLQFLRNNTNGLVTFGLTYTTGGTNSSVDYFTKTTPASAAQLSIVPETSGSLVGILIGCGLLSNRRRKG